MIAEDRVLALLEGKHETHVVAIFRDMRHTDAAQFRRVEAGNIIAVDPDLTGGRFANTGNRFQKFALAIAGHAGYPDDLAGAHVEGDVVDHDDAAIVLDGQVADRQENLARIGRHLLHMQQHATADHQLGKFLHRRFRCLAGRDHFAAAHD